jgi:AraC family transcriptional regulator, glycine betaine-responsive activator
LRYYHHLRLMKARQRVLYSNDSLREIAASVGYHDLKPDDPALYRALRGLAPGRAAADPDDATCAQSRVQAAE